MNNNRGWVLYTLLLVLFWGVWGAFSSLPTELYGYPDEMIYIIWALTMLVPCYFALRGVPLDRRPTAAVYGLLIGLTGAGGQLLLFQALTIGPAYLIFPVISISPAVTVLLALVLLRERTSRLGTVGIAAALIAIILFSISDTSVDAAAGSWLLLAILIALAWGVQAFLMKKASSLGVNDGSIFAYMTLSGLLLIPLALATMPGSGFDFPWQAPALTTLTQLLNAVGALFLVMALSRGKAVIVAPSTNALAPVLTIALSLVFYNTLPSLFSGVGMALALAGSTLMVYTEEKRSARSAPPEAEEPGPVATSPRQQRSR